MGHQVVITLPNEIRKSRVYETFDEAEKAYFKANKDKLSLDDYFHDISKINVELVVVHD